MESLFTKRIPEGSLVRINQHLRRDHDNRLGMVVKSYNFQEPPLDWNVVDLIWSDGQMSIGVPHTQLLVVESE
jgi:hypothetical protein